MRIEVLIGSEEPQIFPLNSPRIILGSGDNCDVILPAHNISRKHLAIITEDDKYYVADQGSTNGTFINEERLIPGKKVEFTSFFPVRLGDSVLVSLLSDDEVSDDEVSPLSIPTNKPAARREDVTTVINPKELMAVKTEKLVIERNIKRTARKQNPKKAPVKKVPKKETSFGPWIFILVFASAAYYNYRLVNPTKAEKVKSKEAAKVVAKVFSKELIPPKEFPSKETILEKISFQKCSIDIEIYLCNLLKATKQEAIPTQVTLSGLSAYVIIDGRSYIEEAKKYLKNPQDQKLLNNVASYIYLMNHMPLLDMKIVKDIRLFIAFVRPGETGPVITSVIAIKAPVFNKTKGQLKPGRLGQLKTIGGLAIKYTNGIYTVY